MYNAYAVFFITDIMYDPSILVMINAYIFSMRIFIDNVYTYTHPSFKGNNRFLLYGNAIW